MAIKTYRAASPSQALALVKKDIGPDAVILHTRTFKTGGIMGIGAKTITEITATSAANAGASPAPRASRSREREQSEQKTPVSQRISSDRAALLRDAVELSSNARAQSRTQQETRTPAPHASAASPAETIVLEPEPQQRPQPRSASQPQRHGTGDTSSRLDAIDTGGASTGTDRSRAVIEPKPVSVRPIGEPALRSQPGRSGAGESPDNGGGVGAELAELKRMMGQVLRNNRSRSAVALPPALENVSAALEESELDSELIDRLIAGIAEELRPEELEDERIVQQVALRRLAALIPVDGSLARAQRPEGGGPLIIALVGPTGVGKTTTVAKLAATYKLRHGANVGLVTSDTYRIAAVDQLRTYANIIGLPIKVTLTPAEMAQAVRAFREYDVVILDTAGRSQNDTTRIDELRGFLDAARPHHTQLVLSATSSARVIKRIAGVFGALEPTHAIATKLDEGVALGPVIDAVRGLNVPLSFVTTGQEVPDQIETACADRLARRVLTSPGGDA